MILPSGIPVSFIKHHINEYNKLSSIFENRFDYHKVFDFIDNYIIDELFPDTYKVTINIWTGTYEYFYLKLIDEFGKELIRLKVKTKNGFFYIELLDTNKEESRINNLYNEYIQTKSSQEFARLLNLINKIK